MQLQTLGVHARYAVMGFDFTTNHSPLFRADYWFDESDWEVLSPAEKDARIERRGQFVADACASVWGVRPNQIQVFWSLVDVDGNAESGEIWHG